MIAAKRGRARLTPCLRAGNCGLHASLGGAAMQERGRGARRPAIFQPMRVAVVVERFDRQAGGVEATACQQVEELARRGVQVTVVCREARGPVPPGVTVERLAVPRFWQPLRLLGFSARCARATRRGFDVVHSLARTHRQDIFRAGGGSHAEYMERVYRHPQLRGLSPRHRAILSIERSVFRDPRQIIQCNARMSAREIAQRYAVPSERLVIVYNGVDTVRFHPVQRETLGASLRRELGLEGLIALFTGSGFNRKGLDRAILGLANSRARATLLVAGRGDPARYRELARENRVEDRVRFLGQRPDVPALYAAADLFVLPTRYDPFANVCLEAMAAGLPVATTANNGAAELIEPGLNGWIGEHDFAPAFDLLAQPELLKSMGRAARQTAEGFSWSRHIDALLPLYERVRQARA
jgi:UDP-glucose:(heptosyl)LPS alpha-1,3-glucosyltransferase